MRQKTTAKTAEGPEGHNVVEAGNGIEALHLPHAHTGEIDLVITDVVMPQMGGKELANRLRADYPNIRVLFTSGYTDDAVLHKGVLDAGLVFLRKPFTPAALAHKVREVLDGRDAFDHIAIVERE